MENLSYAVIDKDDNVVDILGNFEDAFVYAMKIKAYCVETLEGFNGHDGVVVDTYYIEKEVNMAKQKLLAIALFVVALITIPALDFDCTVALVLIPLAVGLFVAKDYWLAD